MAVDRGIRVLVVEELATTGHAIAVLLEQLGFSRVEHLNNAEMAWSLIVQGRYGLVLADWEMSPVTGYELLRRVRADPAIRRLPFILLTSEVRVDKVIAARQAGVSGYLVKPFSDALLRQKLLAIMGEFQS